MGYKPFRILSFAAVLSLFVSAPIFSDSLQGRVLDPSGQAAPNAQVRLFDRARGEMHTTTANANGEYRFPSV